MIFAPTYSGHERSVIARLHLLGLDGELAIRPRHEFRTGLRDRLVTEAGRTDGCEQAPDLALACH